jgi:hypothetical protein
MANTPLNDIMNRFGAAVVERAMLNLGVYRTVKGKKRRAVASDTLRTSLAYYYNGKSSKIEFFAKGKAANYASVVEFGRRKGAKMPPIEAIVQWMKIKPIRVRDDKGKIVKQTPSVVRTAAYNIAKGISFRGIPPLFYWRDAVNDVIVEFQPEFESALEKEINLIIEDTLQKKIKV